MPDNESAIGIFDSGVGGLTVFRRISECLPHETVIYLGDTARVPYGTKSEDTVIRYARACTARLLDWNIKLLVVACNTASAYALNTLRAELDIPVLGVIEPGALAAVRKTANRRIGVIGTAGTIESRQYPRTIHALDSRIEVFSKPCPLFVPLAEEGWTAGDVPRRIAAVYLEELVGNGIDTLVLGCTHYPLLKDVIREAMGENVTLVDSAEATADAVREVITQQDIACRTDAAPKHVFLVSDAPESFARVGRRFLGSEIGQVDWTDF